MGPMVERALRFGSDGGSIRVSNDFPAGIGLVKGGEEGHVLKSPPIVTQSVSADFELLCTMNALVA